MSIITDAAISRSIELIEADINYLGIGTGTTPLAAVDTLLDNEQYRQATTNTIDENTLIIEAYWDETQANGNTYTEAGCFCDGATSSINTGTLFSGGQINVAKDNTQSLTVSIEILFEAVNS